MLGDRASDQLAVVDRADIAIRIARLGDDGSGVSSLAFTSSGRTRPLPQPPGATWRALTVVVNAEMLALVCQS